MQTLPTSCTNTRERKKEKREKQKKKFRETESENNTQRRNREQEIKERNIRNLHNTKEKRGVGETEKRIFFFYVLIISAMIFLSFQEKCMTGIEGSGWI